jgi:GntR family transcriptional regulator of vanillate catabolism
MDTFMDYLRLNEEFHHAFRALAKSPQLDRALEQVFALPFGPPSALLMVAHATMPASWEILLVAQYQHHGLIDAIGRREGARADALAREHALIARRNLDNALENRQLLDRLPGSTLLRLPATAS